MNLESKIEALLFWKAEPIKKKKIAEILDASIEDVEVSLLSLEKNLENRGVTLVKNDDEYELRTSKEASLIIEKITKEELVKDLGKSGLETLAIILYKNPIKRSEIDYIRGVNSSFIIRNLLMRGLVERVSDDKDKKSFFYKPTIDLISHLGIAKIEDLPEYEKVINELKAIEESENAGNQT